MAFYKFDSLDLLDDSKDEWKIRVRAQTIWKGVNRQTGELRGYNLIFCDDYGSRIHAFIAAAILPKFESILEEGDIYIVEMFKVKTYNGDETNRPIRNEKHIYFSNDTEMEKDVNPGLPIPAYTFDFYNLEECAVLKNDNRFLTDVVGVIEDVHPRATYMKDGEDKSHVALTISNGRTTINVTFFNQFGDYFQQQYENIKERPVIIIIACGKVSEWKNVIYITNFPATRIYLNVDHSVINGMRLRYAKPDFYVMDMDDEDDCIELPTMKLNELVKLNETFVLKKVVVQVTVKKFDEKMNWYTPFCLKCDKDLKLVDDIYSCCGRSYSYPDIRFRLYALCSDDSGCLPIVWPDDEVTRLLGKTVYDVDADHNAVTGLKVIPDILRSLEKKNYNITIDVTDKNIKEGSKVFYATYISEPLEFTDNHSPSQKPNLPMQQTELTNVSDKQTPSNNFSPPTVVSTNRTRPRVNVEPLQYNQDQSEKQPKFKNIKIEKP